MSNITIKNLKTSGTIYKTVANDTVWANASEDVVIKDCVFDGRQYNTILTHDKTGMPIPKTVTVENCDFPGEVVNNAISVLSLQEGGSITVKNCHFASVSNAFRFCNKTNVSGVTITIEDCVCDKWDSDLKLAGFFIFEDVNSKSAETAADNNRFAPEKVKVVVKNLIGPDGNKIMPEDLSVCMGTMDSNQIGFVCIDKSDFDILPYSATHYPEFTFE